MESFFSKLSVILIYTLWTRIKLVGINTLHAQVNFFLQCKTEGIIGIREFLEDESYKYKGFIVSEIGILFYWGLSPKMDQVWPIGII